MSGLIAEIKVLLKRFRKTNKGNILEKAYSAADKASAVVAFAEPDRKLALWLFQKLKDDNREVWSDWDTSPPNAEWIANVYKEIESNDIFIFIISPDSIRSENCDWAIEHAVKTCKKIVPVVYKDVTYSEVRPEIASLDWLFFREDGDEWADSFKQLLERMEHDFKHTRYHTVLLSNAIKWETEDYEKSFLLEGDDLDKAQAWVSASALGAEPTPTPLHMSYINASRNLYDVMSRRKMVAFFFLIIVAIAIVWPSWGVFFFALIFTHIFVYIASN